METIQLTDAELELIRIKREEEKLAKERKLAEEIAEWEKSRIQMIKLVDHKVDMINRSNSFLNRGWLELQKSAQCVGLYEYCSLGERTFKETLEDWSYVNSVEEFAIKRKDIKYYIKARDKITYDSGYSRRSIHHGLHFYMEGLGWKVEERNYSKILTCHTKIQDAINVHEREVKKNSIEDNAVLFAQKHLEALYPDATVMVTKEREYNYSTRRSSDSQHIEARIRFTNGWGVKILVYPNWNNPEEPTYSSASVLNPIHMNDVNIKDISTFDFVNNIQNIKY